MPGLARRRMTGGSASRPAALFEDDDEDLDALAETVVRRSPQRSAIDRLEQIAGLYAVQTETDHPMPVHTLQCAIDFLDPVYLPRIAAVLAEMLTWPAEGTP